jgi:hydrogenase maturation protein HypF
MCAECQREYDDPRDRRFHAQPNACPQCGPQVEFRWVDEAQAGCRGEEAMRKAQRALVDGSIVAVKGIGGFHLACDAANDAAVRKLRERKGRVDKPFAVMARDLATAARYAEINEQERALLVRQRAPDSFAQKEGGRRAVCRHRARQQLPRRDAALLAAASRFAQPHRRCVRAVRRAGHDIRQLRRRTNR